MDKQPANYARLPVTKLINLLFFLFISVPVSGYALPPDFTAQYTATKYGASIARATYVLKHTENSVIFTQDAFPIGLAALFSDEELSETSRLSVHNGQLLLDEYHYTQKNSDKNRDVHITIKWRDKSEDKMLGVITGTAGGERIRHRTNSTVWDTLSFQLPLMMNQDNSTLSGDYTILVKGELNTYKLVALGQDKIKVGNKSVNTIKIERKGPDESKSLFIWVAPELHNLPVKIEKWKNGKPNITMLLDSATSTSDKNLRFEAGEDIDGL